jgi:hypothetical protein
MTLQSNMTPESKTISLQPRDPLVTILLLQYLELQRPMHQT